ncbi:hypothetical protein GQ55_2G013200 [Panicum hallii var. hallii]|uniref:F-box protein AT5G49610-like beta-propeller domain-containing protein n=1 Tax=Panicum hallii var. hallii TaxID=1504633 RepID=A0A2T7EKA5_9POAL|nr:hypothetical protein GQ55_2G013200 [Panicum hallii var. hallii]
MAMAALMDELIEEVLRLPASEPACLVRAALVCKRWCSTVSDAGFRRRFREFHRAPPTIGVVYNAVDGDAYVARFRPCASSFPPRADRRGSGVLDCRHGRVLLRGMPRVGKDLRLTYLSALGVWDPVTDEQWEVPLPSLYPNDFYERLVLCAAAATGTCDHLDCHGGPFLVVLVGIDYKHDMFVYTYSSEAAAWREPSSIHLGTALDRPCNMLGPGLVAGDAIYFFLADGHRILKYDLGGGHALSVIKPPLPSSLRAQRKVALMEAKDGGLRVANVEGYNLHVWSCRPAGGPNGVEQWVKDQVIKLDTVVSIATGDPSTTFDVLGFGEGTDVIFISANAGIFAVWRNSGRVMKAGEKRAIPRDFGEPMYCYQSFYIPALGHFLKKANRCMNY